jgi:hypothetical protein
MGEQEQAERVGREYQKVAEVGFETAIHSLGEINRGFQAIARMTDFSKSLRGCFWYVGASPPRAKFREVIGSDAICPKGV